MRRTLISPHRDFTLQKRWHQINRKSGEALKGHCKNAHSGKFDETCPACQELKKASEESK